jgi:hypothetical protein
VKVDQLLRLPKDQQREQLLSAYLTQDQMEEYGKVQALISTNKAAESYVARSTIQPSVAPPVTEEELKQKQEKKHADLVKLIQCLHYYFMTNPLNASIPLSTLIKAVGVEN